MDPNLNEPEDSASPPAPSEADPDDLAGIVDAPGHRKLEAGTTPEAASDADRGRVPEAETEPNSGPEAETGASRVGADPVPWPEADAAPPRPVDPDARVEGSRPTEPDAWPEHGASAWSDVPAVDERDDRAMDEELVESGSDAALAGGSRAAGAGSRPGITARLFDRRRPGSTAGTRPRARARAERQITPGFRADPEAICPFLVSASGGWRMAVPSREHRCGAVNPAAPLAPQKQTRLCLTEGHLRCATYLAAASAREARVGSAAIPDRVSRWALARTVPVVEEVGGVRTTLTGFLGDRRRWPAVPAMLLVVALATLGLSSLRGEGPVSAFVSPSPDQTQIPIATPTPLPTAALATPEPSVAATAQPTPSPTPEPTPEASHSTYTVVSGDTLYGIARQFSTTVAAISDLNGITDPSKLHVGQVLLIP